MAKFGHAQGTKHERKDASAWYRTIEEENIRRIEAEWAARQVTLTVPPSHVTKK